MSPAAVWYKLKHSRALAVRSLGTSNTSFKCVRAVAAHVAATSPAVFLPSAAAASDVDGVDVVVAVAAAVEVEVVVVVVVL